MTEISDKDVEWLKGLSRAISLAERDRQTFVDYMFHFYEQDPKKVHINLESRCFEPRIKENGE